MWEIIEHKESGTTQPVCSGPLYLAAVHGARRHSPGRNGHQGGRCGYAGQPQLMRRGDVSWVFGWLRRIFISITSWWGRGVSSRRVESSRAGHGGSVKLTDQSSESRPGPTQPLVRVMSGLCQGLVRIIADISHRPEHQCHLQSISRLRNDFRNDTLVDLHSTSSACPRVFA